MDFSASSARRVAARAAVQHTSAALPKTKIHAILKADVPKPLLAGERREDPMARILFTNVTILDGSGIEPFAGEVLVDGNRIKSVARGRGTVAADGAERVDGGGATLM